MSAIINSFLVSIVSTLTAYLFGVIILNGGKIKKTTKDIVIFIIICMLHTIIFLLIKNAVKTLLLMSIFALLFKFIFNTGWLKSIFTSIIYIIILTIPDLLTLGFATKVLGISKEVCDAKFAGSVLGSIAILLLMIPTTYILRKPLKKLLSYKLSENGKIVVMSLLSLVSIALFFFILINGFKNNKNVFPYLVVIFSVIVILIYSFYQKISNENILKKYDDLLKIMKSYEKDIDDQRTFIHETKNELLTIKSKLDPKKDAKLMEYVDSILGDKKMNNSARYSKLRYLPSNGIKGFVYYKLIEAKEKGITVSINVGKQVEKSFLEDMEVTDFKNLVRIIGVYIDNAIEASSISEKKTLGLEVYVVEGDIQIIISNSYSNDLDKEKIGNERFSTKGKNRGYGLLLVKRILNNSKTFESKTKITDKVYIQTLLVKDKKKNHLQ